MGFGLGICKTRLNAYDIEFFLASRWSQSWRSWALEANMLLTKDKSEQRRCRYF